MKEINKIIQFYDQINWSQEQAALATVVRVEESAYRRIGARMLVSSKGIWTGGISGGCLEGDALKRAQMAIGRRRSSIIVYDTLEDDAHQIGVGLGCNGRIDVLFTPINEQDGQNPVEQLKHVRNRRQPTVICQVIGTESGDPGLLGAMTIEENLPAFCQSTTFNLKHLTAFCRESLEAHQSIIRSLTTADGSSYEILVEYIRPRVKLICIGDNYDVNAFVSIGHELNWEIHVAGKSRKLSRHVFEFADKVHDFDSIRLLDLDAHTAILLMTHDYQTDLGMLRHFASTKVPYLGILGPKKRTLKMQAELKGEDNGVDLSQLRNLYSPVGLDIGAESPEEIALSIASEIIAVMRNRQGGPLRERQGPIHNRN